MNKVFGRFVVLGFALLMAMVSLSSGMSGSAEAVTSNPISIGSDFDLDLKAASNGWSGNGTEGNPYIISNLEIDATGYNFAIYLFDIHKHLVISNCILQSANLNGIAMVQVSNVRVENNAINNNGDQAILLYSSNNVTISGNYCTVNEDGGFLIQDSSNISVIGNVISNSYDGLILEHVDNSTVNNNLLTLIGACGIYIYYSDNNTFSDNSIDDALYVAYLQFSNHNTINGTWCGYTDMDSIYLYQSNFTAITNNTLEGSEMYAGIYIGYSSNNLVANNKVLDTTLFLTYFGVCLDVADDNLVLNNTFTGSWYGISLSTANGNTLVNNTCTNPATVIKGTGINLDGSHENTVIGNKVNNSYAGITLYSSNSNDVLNNICEHIDGDGILVSDSHHNVVSENVCANNSVNGIAINSADSSSFNNTITNNACFQNGYVLDGAGIYVSSSSAYSSIGNTISYNECDSNNYYGIWVLNSPNNLVYSNNVVNSNGSGILVQGSSGSQVSFNILTMNGDSGLWIDTSEDCVVQYNIAELNTDGIYLSGSNESMLIENTLVSNDYGIILYDSRGNSINGNNGSEGEYGIYIMSNCNDNFVGNNTFSGNSLDGIFIQGPNQNTIFNNTCTLNQNGIRLEGVESSTMANNTCFQNTDTGMYLYSSSYNTISGNIIDRNQYGLTITESSTGNEVFGNGFFDNINTGVYLLSCDGNYVYGNILSGNYGSNSVYGTPQASDSGVNWWNTTTYGNLWLDWTGPDTNSDGIVDSPYILTGLGSQDYYPLSFALEITSPANGSYVGSPIVGLQGTAISQLDSKLTWRNFITGGSGTCIGISAWSAAVPLIEGENEIEVTLSILSMYEVNATITVVLDSIPPSLEITSPANGSIVSDTVTVTWTPGNNGSDVSYYTVSTNGTVWIIVEGDQYTFTDLEQGPQTLWVRAYDVAGNNVTRTVNVTVDTVPPTVEIITPGDSYVNTTGNVTVTWAGSDVSSGVDHYEVSWEGITPVNVTNSTLTYTFTGLSDGSHLFTVVVYDKRGLSHTDTVMVLVDTQVPSLTITSPVQDGFVNSADVTVTWSGSDAGTGIAYYIVSIEGLGFVNTTGTSHTFNDLADGTYTVLVSAYDHLGNYLDVTATFTVDTVVPTLAIDSPTDGQMFNVSSVSITWSTTDDNPGTVQVRFDEEGWVLATGEEFIRTALTEGHHIAYVKVTDAAGNYLERAVNFTVDTIAPTVAFVSPEDGAFVNSSTGTVEWATDEGSSSVRVDGGEWTQRGSFTNWTYSLDDGEHTIEVMVTDQAGNSASATLNIIVDTVAPEAEASPIGDDLELDLVVLVEFSEEMNQTSVSVVVTGTTGTLAWEGNAVMFTPSALYYNREYFVQVTGKDLAGNSMEMNWTFATRSVGNLTGLILDENGDPAVNVTVTAGGEFVAVTDENGRFLFTNLSVGTYLFEVDAEGYQPFTFNATIEQGVTVDEGTVEMVPDEVEGEGDGENSSIWPYIIIAIGVLAVVGVVFFVLFRKK